MKELGINDYDEAEHWAAMNERNVYLSRTEEDRENFMNHVHSSCELLLVERGGAEYTVERQIYRLHGHDLFIIGAADPHRRRITEFPFLRYGLTILPAFLESLPAVNEYANVYRTQTPEDAAKLKNLDDGDFERIRDIFLNLGEETARIRSGSADMIRALLLQLTVFLNRRLGHEKMDFSGNGTYLSMLKIKGYIDANYGENLSLNELSRKFYLQPNTISRAFAECFGINIKNYITSVRIAKAAGVLETSSVSITDLAAQVGYENVNTFIRQFGARMGLSPHKYRNEFREYRKNRNENGDFQEKID